MSDLTPQQRYVHVLKLMEADYIADPAKELWRPFSTAAARLDYVTYVEVQSAMRAGEIPSPAGDAGVWAKFLAAQRERAWGPVRAETPE